MLKAIKYESEGCDHLVPRFRYTRPPIFCIYEAPKGMGLKSLQKISLTDFHFKSGDPKPRRLPVEFKDFNNCEEVINKINRTNRTNWKADGARIYRLGKILFAKPCNSERKLFLAITWNASIEDTVDNLDRVLDPIVLTNEEDPI